MARPRVDPCVAGPSSRCNPEPIPVKMCYLGWQESLEQLARLVEPEIPDE